MKQNEKSTLGRRVFLKGSALAAVGTATAGTLAATGKTAVAEKPEKINAGYRETLHVQQVYKLSRF